jgi:hypothetical protein
MILVDVMANCCGIPFGALVCAEVALAALVAGCGGLRATPAANAGLTRSPGRLALTIIHARFGRLRWSASVGSTASYRVRSAPMIHSVGKGRPKRRASQRPIQ